VRALFFIATLALVAGCDETTTGDLDSFPATGSDIHGDGLRLYQINDGPLKPSDGSEVNVTAVSVVHLDTFDETSDGSSAGNVYVQDLPVNGAVPPFGGMTLFDASYTPPTLRIAAGDVVDVRGTFDAFEGPSSSPFDPGEVLPEIVGGTVSLRFESTIPQPIEIPLADLGSYGTGKRWIGMLVVVKNIAVQEPGFKSQSGRFSVRLSVAGVADPMALPTLTNALFDLEASGNTFDSGTQFSSVVGVVQYFYNFSVAPRSKEDITP
jgi:hypothetical protein